MIRFRGFTLIELLVVIAVIGVLAGATVALIDPSERMKQGSDFAEESKIRTFSKAMEEYAVINGKYDYIRSPGGSVFFDDVSTKLVGAGTLKKALVSIENGYTLYYYSFDNLTSTSFIDGTSTCSISVENCVRFVVYNTSTSFKSKAYKQRFGDGTNAYLVYDSKYQKICGRALDPHTNEAARHCDGT